MMDDYISRQAAIEALDNRFKQRLLENHFESFEEADSEIKWFCDGIMESIGEVMDLPAAQPSLDEWCDDCKEYDKEKHCCPRWNMVIRQTLAEAQPQRMRGRWIDRNGNIVSPFWERYECSECGARSDNTNYCPNCGAQMEVPE